MAVDPDSEIITDTVVSAGNAGDAAVAEDLIGDLVDGDNRHRRRPTRTATGSTTGHEAAGGGDDEQRRRRPTVYGDAAYGTGAFLERLADDDIDSRCKTQPPHAPGGLFTKDDFTIDLEDDTVTCPDGVTVHIRRRRHGDGIASSLTPAPTARCARSAPPRSRPHIRSAATSTGWPTPAGSQDPDWDADYRATRPKVERKLGHLMRRRHGGRRARVRGQSQGRRRLQPPRRRPQPRPARRPRIALHPTGWTVAVA